MPRLTYDTDESHALLTQAETAAAGDDPALADLYRQLATVGLDLEACTPDETLRTQLGMPPLPGTDAGDGQDGTSGPSQPDGQHDGGHPRVA